MHTGKQIQSRVTFHHQRLKKALTLSIPKLAVNEPKALETIIVLPLAYYIRRGLVLLSSGTHIVNCLYLFIPRPR